MTPENYVSQRLLKAQHSRFFFDVNNEEHMRAYAAFRKGGNWTINFHYEPPFTTVPITIENKILDHVASRYV